MVSIKIYINDFLIDLDSSEDYTQVFQVNTIADISTRQTNYTVSMKIPKTERNVLFFEMLSIPSDTSTFPYKKLNAVVTWNDIPITIGGWANITNTNDTYNLHIYDGLIDFFKAIENKTIGIDLDLTEINHDKNLATVIASQTNQNYRYLIADYNGKTHFGANIINIDYLIPSVRVRYLWDKIMTTFGFGYLGNIFTHIDFDNLWLTYPKFTDAGLTTEQVASIHLFKFRAKRISVFSNKTFHYGIIDNQTITSGQIVQYGYNTYGNDNLTGHYIFGETAQYKIVISGTYKSSPFILGLSGTWVFIAHNSQGSTPYQIPPSNLELISTSNLDDDTQSFSWSDVRNFNYGESIAIMQQTIAERNERECDITITISKVVSLPISFTDELKSFTIKDFVKEIFVMFGLTAIPNKWNKDIKYLTLEERLKTAKIIDWTSKYHDRINETYIYGQYAKRNVLRHNYNDKESNYNDGGFEVANENLNDSKDLFKSKIFTPEKILTTFPIYGKYKNTSTKLNLLG